MTDETKRTPMQRMVCDIEEMKVRIDSDHELHVSTMGLIEKLYHRIVALEKAVGMEEE